MKKKLVFALCALMLTAALLGSALAIDFNFQVPTLDDMLIKHRVFLSDQTDSYSEFLVIFYRESNHELVQFNDETVFYPSSGIGYGDLDSLDFESVYPGVNSMSFVDIAKAQRSDGCSIAIRFCQLGDNWRELVNRGILVATFDGQYMDAFSICDSIVARGMRELDMTEYDDYGLNFEVVD